MESSNGENVNGSTGEVQNDTDSTDNKENGNSNAVVQEKHTSPVIEKTTIKPVENTNSIENCYW